MLAVQARARLGAARARARSRTSSSRSTWTQLNVRPADPDRPIRISPAATSRRCSSAAGSRRTPSCCILDEPTRGIDVGAKAEIQEAVAELAEGGIARRLHLLRARGGRAPQRADRRAEGPPKIGEIVNGPEVTAESDRRRHRHGAGRRRTPRPTSLAEEVAEGDAPNAGERVHGQRSRPLLSDPVVLGHRRASSVLLLHQRRSRTRPTSRSRVNPTTGDSRRQRARHPARRRRRSS